MVSGIIRNLLEPIMRIIDRNSRPPAMESASFRDQESMSSGDESDNGDDTDGMSDTDYSDVPDGMT